MRPHRRRVLALAATLLPAPALVRPAAAQAPDVTLRLHHFLPAASNAHRNFLTPWSRKIEADSQGKLRVQLFPSMQLGGAPPQLFDQARDGVVDIVWTLPGYTAGRFPRTEAIELPFVGASRGVVNSRAMQDFADQHLRTTDLAEVHLVTMWANDRNVFHSRKQIRNLDDLRGQKIRFPARMAGESLKALGAAPIGMPVPQVPESLAQGVIDGGLIPWEVAPALKLHELVKFHTEIEGTPTLYTSAHMLVMNKARHASLPTDLRRVFDENSGQLAASIAGKAWDDAVAPAVDLARKRGNTIDVVGGAELARWREVTKPVATAWLAESKAKGFDGETLAADIVSLVQKHEAAA